MRNLILAFLLCASLQAQNVARMLSGVNYQTGTTYTFVASDTTKVVSFNNASPVAVTLPAGTTANFGAGAVLSMRNVGVGTVTITCSSCTINGSGTLALTTGQSSDLYSDGTNYVANQGAGGTGVPAVGGLFGSYTFSVSGGTVSAVNNATGSVAFSGTDLAAVFNNVTTANATGGARLFFKAGIYPINSMTAESATGCSNFGGSGNLLAYALSFPVNTPIANSVQWFIEGEATTVFQGHAASTTVNTAGVVFNVTATAVSSVAANSVLAGVWQRPINNCTLSDTTNFNNQIYIRNVTLLFPTNQRGNELAFAPYFASSVGYKNVAANFNLTNNAIATGSAPVVGSYNSVGIASTSSGAGNIENFEDTFATGYNIGYDFQSELINSKNSSAVYNNFPAWFGRSGGSVFHYDKVEHFVDQENLNGIQFGSQLQPGTHIDILGLDIELGVANWYARTAIGMTESTPLTSGGLITYTAVTQNGGINSGQAQLFAPGSGGLFTTMGAPTNLAQVPGADSFSRPGSLQVGPGWVNNYTFAGANSFSITSNALGCGSNCFMSYGGQTANNDQFSKATVASIDSATTTLVGVTTNQTQTLSVKTFYSYFASHTAGGGTTIGKNVAGVGTALCTQTSTVGVNAGDTLELRHIGTWLYAYRNGILDANLGSCNPISDSSISGGQPGLFQSVASANATTETTWSGGSLPTMHGTDSIYNNPIYATGYNTIGNCAAVGTAANPSVASCVAATVGSVSCATNASTGTCTVNTTTVTANSEIFLNQRADTTTGTRLGVTCNTTKDTNSTSPQITAVTAGTSFTFQLGTITTNPECFSFHIVN